MKEHSCRICGNDIANSIDAREHLLRTQEVFSYGHCVSCGCMQISEIPTDLSPYYDASYGTLRASPLKQAIRNRSYKLAYRGGLIGRALGAMLPAVHYGVISALRDHKVARDARILDVGSGSGRFLRALRGLGYGGELLGIDPYLPEPSKTPDGVELRNVAIDQVEGSFDVITLIHVLEHLPDQAQTLAQIKRLLAPNGICLISVPVAQSSAWSTYGTDWVQLDPPRHLFLHTEKSLNHVASAVGLGMREVIWDSTSFQFWGSERVRKGRPILPIWKSFLANAWRIPYDGVRATRRNREAKGDQATFVLTH